MSYSEKYAQKEFIGRGQFGKVYLVVAQNHELNVAKKIELDGMSSEEIQLTMKEVSIHRSLKHPNIIEFKEFFLEDKTLIVIMEYCEYGDLSFYINKRKEKNELFEQKVIMNLFMQLVFGMNYLHESKVLHRDLKTSNVFVNSNGQLKLGDFGISRVMEHTQEVALTLVGTPYYLSPQICKNQGYTFKSDVWALGCILYELCTLQRAFAGTNVLSLANKIVNEEVPNIPSHYSRELNQLIKWLLEKDPNKRPLIRDIFQNKLVEKYTNKFTSTKEGFRSPQKEVSQTPKMTSKAQQQAPNKRYKIIETNGELEQTSMVTQQEDFLMKNRSQSVDDFMEISPVKSRDKVGLMREKCEGKMGKKLFGEIYQFMRQMKRKGLQDMDLRKRYSKTQFDYAMDVAQLIYIEDCK